MIKEKTPNFDSNITCFLIFILSNFEKPCICEKNGQNQCSSSFSGPNQKPCICEICVCRGRVSRGLTVLLKDTKIISWL